jgi:hypothetical protein
MKKFQYIPVSASVALVADGVAFVALEVLDVDKKI